MAPQPNHQPLPNDLLEQAAHCLRVMAHPARLRMVELLLSERQSVGQLAERCGLRPHQACEHLRLLQNCGYLSSERQGREVYYQVISSTLPALIACIRASCPKPHASSARKTLP